MIFLFNLPMADLLKWLLGAVLIVCIGARMRKRDREWEDRKRQYRAMVEKKHAVVNTYFNIISDLYSEGAVTMRHRMAIRHCDFEEERKKYFVDFKNHRDFFFQRVIAPISEYDSDRAAILRNFIHSLETNFMIGMFRERFSDGNIKMFELFIVELMDKFSLCMTEPLDDKCRRLWRKMNKKKHLPMDNKIIF